MRRRKSEPGGRHQPNKSSPCWSLRCSDAACVLQKVGSSDFNAAPVLQDLSPTTIHSKSEEPTFEAPVLQSAAPVLHIKIRDSNLTPLAVSLSIRPS